MADELDVSFNASITVAQRDALLRRLKAARANLPPETQAALKPMLEYGHRQLAAYLCNGTPADSSTHQTLRMKSYLTGDSDSQLARLGQRINNAPRHLASELLRLHLPGRQTRDAACRAETSLSSTPERYTCGRPSDLR
jgi:hypothetical protein